MKAPKGRHQETDRSQVANPRGSSGVCGETAVVALLLTSRSEMSRSDKCSGLEASSHVRIGLKKKTETHSTHFNLHSKVSEESTVGKRKAPSVKCHRDGGIKSGGRAA